MLCNGIESTNSESREEEADNNSEDRGSVEVLSS